MHTNIARTNEDTNNPTAYHDTLDAIGCARGSTADMNPSKATVPELLASVAEQGTEDPVEGLLRSAARDVLLLKAALLAGEHQPSDDAIADVCFDLERRVLVALELHRRVVERLEADQVEPARSAA